MNKETYVVTNWEIFRAFSIASVIVILICCGIGPASIPFQVGSCYKDEYTIFKVTDALRFGIKGEFKTTYGGVIDHEHVAKVYIIKQQLKSGNYEQIDCEIYEGTKP